MNGISSTEQQHCPLAQHQHSAQSSRSWATEVGRHDGQDDECHELEGEGDWQCRISAAHSEMQAGRPTCERPHKQPRSFARMLRRIANDVFCQIRARDFRSRPRGVGCVGDET
jgi:hypothetical protein